MTSRRSSSILESDKFLRNKRHVGNSTTVRITRNVCLTEPHGKPIFIELESDGTRPFIKGILGYSNGNAEFETPLTDAETQELYRLFRGVAERVQWLLMDNASRRASSRGLSRSEPQD